MAILQLKCVNQVLAWEDRPDIYSGNVNIDTVKFDFCELWDGYIKTAVFKCEGIDPILVAMNDNCMCNLPHEVTKASGVITISVFGDKDDTRRTSSEIEYYFYKGADTDGVLSEPTPDIYSQICNLCTQAVNTAESVRTDADNGVFDGKDGADGHTPIKGIDYFTEAEKTEMVRACVPKKWKILAELFMDIYDDELVIDTDEAGNPFEITEFYIIFRAIGHPDVTSIAGTRVRINGTEVVTENTIIAAGGGNMWKLRGKLKGSWDIIHSGSGNSQDTRYSLTSAIYPGYNYGDTCKSIKFDRIAGRNVWVYVYGR